MTMHPGFPPPGRRDAPRPEGVALFELNRDGDVFIGLRHRPEDTYTREIARRFDLPGPGETRAMTIDELGNRLEFDFDGRNSIVIVPATKRVRKLLRSMVFMPNLLYEPHEFWLRPRNREIRGDSVGMGFKCTTGDFIQLERVEEHYKLLEWSSILPILTLLDMGLPGAFSEDRADFGSIAFDNGHSIDQAPLSEIHRIVATNSVHVISLRIFANGSVFGWSSDWGFHAAQVDITDIVVNQCSVLTTDPLSETLAMVESSGTPPVGDFAAYGLAALDVI
jgi:hypothetical protein